MYIYWHLTSIARAIVNNDEEELMDKQPPKKCTLSPNSTMEPYAEPLNRLQTTCYHYWWHQGSQWWWYLSIASISPAACECWAGKTQDVDAFFKAREAVCQPDGSFKNLCTCKKCLYVHPLPNWTFINCCLRWSTVCITLDIMTCWQHIEANHAVILPSLLKWVPCLLILSFRVCIILGATRTNSQQCYQRH